MNTVFADPSAHDWVTFTFQLIHSVDTQTCVYRYLFESLLSDLGGIGLGMELLGDTVILCLAV